MWRKVGRLRGTTELIQPVNQIICSHCYYYLSSFFPLTLFDCLEKHKQKQTKTLFFLPQNMHRHTLMHVFQFHTTLKMEHWISRAVCIALPKGFGMELEPNTDSCWRPCCLADLRNWLTIVPQRKTHFLLWDPEHCPPAWRKRANSGAGSQY